MTRTRIVFKTIEMLGTVVAFLKSQTVIFPADSLATRAATAINESLARLSQFGELSSRGAMNS